MGGFFFHNYLAWQAFSIGTLSALSGSSRSSQVGYLASSSYAVSVSCKRGVMGDSSVSSLAMRSFALRADAFVACDTADLSDADRSVLPNTRGHIRTRMSLNVGKQAHIKPTLISIVAHSATGNSSHVGLMELAK